MQELEGQRGEGAYFREDTVLNFMQCLECRQIYVQIYIAISRRGRGLGLRKSTVFYMDLPAL